LLAAKTTSNTRFYHADAFDWQANTVPTPADVEGNLRAGADYQPVIFIPITDGNIGSM